LVSIGGVPDVVNVITAPSETPVPFEARAQKWYVTPFARPEIGAEKGTALLPEPSAVPPLDGWREPKLSLHVPELVAL